MIFGIEAGTYCNTTSLDSIVAFGAVIQKFLFLETMQHMLNKLNNPLKILGDSIKWMHSS